MIDYESTRAAFEAAHADLILSRMDGGRYRSGMSQLHWEAWCRALDYAAQQQQAPSEHVCALHMDMMGKCFVCGAVNESVRAAQEADEARHRAEQQPAPAPLPRPDKPGWWWCWEPDRKQWRVGRARMEWPTDEENAKKKQLVWWSPGCGYDADKINVINLIGSLWLPATPPPAPNGLHERPGATTQKDTNAK